MLFLTIAVLILLVTSAICSSTEAAIFSLPIAKAKQLASKGRNGKTVCWIRENPARPISTIVICNNLANIVGTYFVARLATTALSEAWQTWFPFLLTVMVIVISEIIPKAIGERFSSAIVQIFARPLVWITYLITPVVWALEKFISVLIGNSRPATTSEMEIKALVHIGQQEGVVEIDESQMVARVFELNDHTAADIMTPRTALSWIRGKTPLSEAKTEIGTSQHTRIVVVGETIDEILGVVLKSKILELIVTGQDETVPIKKFAEPVNVVSIDTQADALLEHFQNTRMHLVVVMDEYGGMAGVVTLEDVLEVLTGEIMDETDRDQDMRVVAAREAHRKLAEQGVMSPHIIFRTARLIKEEACRSAAMG